MSDDAHGAQEVIHRLFVAMRTAGLHGEHHIVTEQAMDALSAAVLAASPPFSLQFVAQAVFRDRTLVPLDVEQYARAATIAHAASNLSAHELTFEGPLSREGAFRLSQALFAAQTVQSEELDASPVPGVQHREIANARFGEESEAVDPEVAAIAQVALALSAADAVVASPDPWPWGEVLSVIRRLERARAAHGEATARTLEIAPDGFSRGRRAAGAANIVLALFGEIGGSRRLSRSAAHAAFALAVCGYEERGGAQVDEAAKIAFARLSAAPVRARSGIDPHRLQTTAIVFAMTPGARVAHPVCEPIAIAYDMERGRSPSDARIDLALVDLVAGVAAKMGRPWQERWVHTLVGALGTVPPGSWVRLPSGEIGRAVGVGASGDPLRPDVLVRGQRCEAPGPVRLLPPHERPASGTS